MTALFPALVSSHGKPLTWLDGEQLPRCAGCGHRQPHPVTGEIPRETRRQAPWTWPRELVSRRRAQRAR
jgi:hypothetical protein